MDEVMKTNNKIIVLEKILKDCGESEEYIDQLSISYQEKTKFKLEKGDYDLSKYFVFAEEYMTHLRDIIKMKYKSAL
jgi:hypothetical protein